MTVSKDFDVLIKAFDQTEVFYRELPMPDVLRLAGVCEMHADAPVVRAVELAGGDVIFFDDADSYVGTGSWAGETPMFCNRGQDEMRPVTRSSSPGLSTEGGFGAVAP